jgi:very-short-patch-repair endonuclease
VRGLCLRALDGPFAQAILFSMLGRHDRNPRLKRFARHLRKQSTDAERKLWALIRDGQLAGFRFRRQHPVGGYIVDFACLKANLIVELDGGQHADPANAAYDAQRTLRLEELKMRVLRFADHEMLKDPEAVVRTIYREVTAEEPSP